MEYICCIRCERKLTSYENDQGICYYCQKELIDKYGKIAEEVIELYKKQWEFLGRWREGENGYSDEKEGEA